MSSKSSKTDPAAEAAAGTETVTVARIRRARGLRGDLLVDLLSDVPDRLAEGSELFLVDRQGRRTKVRIARSGLKDGDGAIRLEGWEDRAAVEGLNGSTLEVARAEVPPAPEGSYYFFELVGCRCLDRRLGELGEVREVVEDGGGHLLRVDDRNRELLIPFVKAYLIAVDRIAGTVEVDLPEGLVETCASPS